MLAQEGWAIAGPKSFRQVPGILRDSSLIKFWFSIWSYQILGFQSSVLI